MQSGDQITNALNQALAAISKTDKPSSKLSAKHRSFVLSVGSASDSNEETDDAFIRG